MRTQTHQLARIVLLIGKAWISRPSEFFRRPSLLSGSNEGCWIKKWKSLFEGKTRFDQIESLDKAKRQALVVSFSAFCYWFWEVKRPSENIFSDGL